jgi:RND family efflux transporter, MFP subunit
MMKSLPVLFLTALALSACRQPVASSPSGPPPAPVEIAVAERRTVPVEMKAIGTVEPVASVQIKSKVQGEILQVHFADGAEVKAGDLLFSIDPRTFEAALKRAEANLAIAKATAENATEQAERYTTLIKRGVASREQTSQFLATAESQKSELAARQADVDEARLSLEWTQVRAPISGRAGAALLKAGNIAQPNVDTLAVINQMQPIYVTFSLPENSLASVRQWMNQGRPTVTAYEPDTGRVLGEGELTFIDNSVDRGSGMIAFKATFPNTDELLWPGQFVDVTVKLAEEPDALVIPTTAVTEGRNGAQVFVVEGDRAVLRPVEVERMIGDRCVIRSGLQPGEQVITTGQLRVTPGGRITVTKKDTPAEPQGDADDGNPATGS